MTWTHVRRQSQESQSRPRQESPLQEHAYPFGTHEGEPKGSPLAIEGGASPLTELPLAEAESQGSSPESSAGASFRMRGLFRRSSSKEKGGEGSPSQLRRSEAQKARVLP